MELIDKAAVVAEITHKIKVLEAFVKNFDGISDKVEKAKNKIEALNDAILYIDTLEVKDVEDGKLPNPRFPQYENIVDKVFGAGNLETWEREEAEQLVLLAKEELLKDLEVKEVDLEHEVESYWKQCDMTWCRDAYSMTHIRSMLSDIAKHFFELGIAVSNKAQRGE